MATENKVMEYFKGAKTELTKKVQWPSAEATRRNTIMVISISLAVAVFIGVFDFLFQLLLELLINR